jgi:hypothetical protein
VSGRKNNLRQFHNISSGDMSTASITSAVTNIQWLDNIGIQLNWTGSPVGDFAVQISADYAQDQEGNVTSTGNWVPLTLTYLSGASMTTATSIPTTVGSPIYLDLNQLSAPWIRVVYTKASGTGTLNGFITAKLI